MSGSRAARTGLVLTATSLLTVAAPAQQPTPPPIVFGTGIEVINLNVTVTDPRGQYVTGLDKEEFSVYEDGVKQDVSLFRHEDLPLSLVLLIDTSSSMETKLNAAREAASRFIGTMRPQDVAQIVQFNDRTTVLQDFTSDQKELVDAVHRTRASGPTALRNALYISLKDLSKQAQGGELRRRAVIILSDGEDTASLVTDDQVTDLARRTEINVYAISLRPARNADRESVQFSRAAHLLTVLARDSGGQVHFANDLSELDAVYDRIAEELRTQYNLGYVSRNARRDGKWRRIVVRIPERDELLIRHKIGYYAPGT